MVYVISITLSGPVITDTGQVRLWSNALDSTLAVLNPVGVEIVLTMMDRACGVSCTEYGCSSKEEIENALLSVLGKEAGAIVIREWNRKIHSKAYS